MADSLQTNPIYNISRVSDSRRSPWEYIQNPHQVPETIGRTKPCLCTFISYVYVTLIQFNFIHYVKDK